MKSTQKIKAVEPPDFIEIDAYEYSKGNVTPIEVNVSAEYPVTIMINDNPRMQI